MPGAQPFVRFWSAAARGAYTSKAQDAYDWFDYVVTNAE